MRRNKPSAEKAAAAAAVAVVLYAVANASS